MFFFRVCVLLFAFFLCLSRQCFRALPLGSNRDCFRPVYLALYCRFRLLQRLPKTWTRNVSFVFSFSSEVFQEKRQNKLAPIAFCARPLYWQHYYYCITTSELAAPFIRPMMPAMITKEGAGFFKCVLPVFKRGPYSEPRRTMQPA